MTLNEFINNLKYKSTKLYILEKELLSFDTLVYDDSLGSYIHWVKRNIYDVYKILRITFRYDKMCIEIIKGSDKNDR